VACDAKGAHPSLKLGAPDRSAGSVFLWRGSSRSIFKFRTGLCRGAKTRFRKPLSRPNSSSLQLIPANSSQGLGETGTLAGVLWSSVECRGVEHKMSTLKGFRSQKEKGKSICLLLPLLTRNLTNVIRSKSASALPLPALGIGPSVCLRYTKPRSCSYRHCLEA